MTTPELNAALHTMLLKLQSCIIKQSKLQEETINVLRDVNEELKFMRTERERLWRVERLLLAFDERRPEEGELKKLIDEAKEITARHVAMPDDKKA